MLSQDHLADDNRKLPYFKLNRSVTCRSSVTTRPCEVTLFRFPQHVVDRLRQRRSVKIDRLPSTPKRSTPDRTAKPLKTEARDSCANSNARENHLVKNLLSTTRDLKAKANHTGSSRPYGKPVRDILSKTIIPLPNKYDAARAKRPKSDPMIKPDKMSPELSSKSVKSAIAHQELKSGAANGLCNGIKSRSTKGSEQKGRNSLKKLDVKASSDLGKTSTSPQLKTSQRETSNLKTNNIFDALNQTARHVADTGRKEQPEVKRPKAEKTKWPAVTSYVDDDKDSETIEAIRKFLEEQNDKHSRMLLDDMTFSSSDNEDESVQTNTNSSSTNALYDNEGASLESGSMYMFLSSSEDESNEPVSIESNKEVLAVNDNKDILSVILDEVFFGEENIEGREVEVSTEPEELQNEKNDCEMSDSKKAEKSHDFNEKERSLQDQMFQRLVDGITIFKISVDVDVQKLMDDLVQNVNKICESDNSIDIPPSCPSNPKKSKSQLPYMSKTVSLNEEISSPESTVLKIPNVVQNALHGVNQNINVNICLENTKLNPKSSPHKTSKSCESLTLDEIKTAVTDTIDNLLQAVETACNHSECSVVPEENKILYEESEISHSNKHLCLEPEPPLVDCKSDQVNESTLDANKLTNESNNVDLVLDNFKTWKSPPISLVKIVKHPIRRKRKRRRMNKKRLTIKTIPVAQAKNEASPASATKDSNGPLIAAHAVNGCDSGEHLEINNNVINDCDKNSACTSVFACTKCDSVNTCDAVSDMPDSVDCIESKESIAESHNSLVSPTVSSTVFLNSAEDVFQFHDSTDSEPPPLKPKKHSPNDNPTKQKSIPIKMDEELSEQNVARDISPLPLVTNGDQNSSNLIRKRNQRLSLTLGRGESERDIVSLIPMKRKFENEATYSIVKDCHEPLTQEQSSRDGEEKVPKLLIKKDAGTTAQSGSSFVSKILQDEKDAMNSHKRKGSLKLSLKKLIKTDTDVPNDMSMPNPTKSSFVIPPIGEVGAPLCQAESNKIENTTKLENMEVSLKVPTIADLSIGSSETNAETPQIDSTTKENDSKEEEKLCESISDMKSDICDTNDKPTSSIPKLIQIPSSRSPSPSLLCYAKIDSNHVIKSVNLEESELDSRKDEQASGEVEPGVEDLMNYIVKNVQNSANGRRGGTLKPISLDMLEVMADEVGKEFEFDKEDVESFKESAKNILSMTDTVKRKKRRKFFKGFSDKQKSPLQKVIEEVAQDEQKDEEDLSVSPEMPKLEIVTEVIIEEEEEAAKPLEDTASPTKDSPVPSPNVSTGENETEGSQDGIYFVNHCDRLRNALRNRRRRDTSADIEGMLTRMRSLRNRGGDEVLAVNFDDPIPLEYKERRKNRRRLLDSKQSPKVAKRISMEPNKMNEEFYEAEVHEPNGVEENGSAKVLKDIETEAKVDELKAVATDEVVKDPAPIPLWQTRFQNKPGRKRKFKFTKKPKPASKKVKSLLESDSKRKYFRNCSPKRFLAEIDGQTELDFGNKDCDPYDFSLTTDGKATETHAEQPENLELDLSRNEDKSPTLPMITSDVESEPPTIKIKPFEEEHRQSPLKINVPMTIESPLDLSRSSSVNQDGLPAERLTNSKMSTLSQETENLMDEANAEDEYMREDSPLPHAPYGMLSPVGFSSSRHSAENSSPAPHDETSAETSARTDHDSTEDEPMNCALSPTPMEVVHEFKNAEEEAAMPKITKVVSLAETDSEKSKTDDVMVVASAAHSSMITSHVTSSPAFATVSSPSIVMPLPHVYPKFILPSQHQQPQRTLLLPKPTPVSCAPVSSPKTLPIGVLPMNKDVFNAQYERLRNELLTLDLFARQKEQERNNILRLKQYKQSMMRKLQIKKALIQQHQQKSQSQLVSALTVDGHPKINVPLAISSVAPCVTMPTSPIPVGSHMGLSSGNVPRILQPNYFLANPAVPSSLSLDPGHLTSQLARHEMQSTDNKVTPISQHTNSSATNNHSRDSPMADTAEHPAKEQPNQGEEASKSQAFLVPDDGQNRPSVKGSATDPNGSLSSVETIVAKASDNFGIQFQGWMEDSLGNLRPFYRPIPSPNSPLSCSKDGVPANGIIDGSLGSISPAAQHGSPAFANFPSESPIGDKRNPRTLEAFLRNVYSRKYQSDLSSYVPHVPVTSIYSNPMTAAASVTTSSPSNRERYHRTILPMPTHPKPSDSTVANKGESPGPRQHTNSPKDVIVNKIPTDSLTNSTLAKLLLSPLPETGSPGKNPQQNTKHDSPEIVKETVSRSSSLSPAQTNTFSQTNSVWKKPIEKKLMAKWPYCTTCKSNYARFICAGCNNQWYCSETCQVKDWKYHFKSCRR